MIKLGTIVLSSKLAEPCVVVSYGIYDYKAIVLENNNEKGFAHHMIKEQDMIKDDNYHGHKLERCNANYERGVFVAPKSLRPIAVLTDDGYFAVLKNLISYHAYIGAPDPFYRVIREDVHEQCLKLGNKKFGV